MACVECERLRREVRELKEEISEWSKLERDETLAERLRIRFRLRPQAAYCLAAMMERPGRVFSNDAIIQHIGYNGRPMEAVRNGEAQAVRTNISWVRHGLRDARLGVHVRNVQRQGYMITKEDVEKIRGAL